MDIFKLFYNHDQRLDTTAERKANKADDDPETSLQDFMTPTPTFSKFYLTGTRLDEDEFGLNRLEKYEQIADKLDTVFNDYITRTPTDNLPGFSDAVEHTPVGHPMLLSSDGKITIDLDQLIVDKESNVGHFKEDLRTSLLEGHLVVYKEQARNGFDLHLFSKENIYEQLFYPFRQLVEPSFRFFSINSKRMRTERHFYFETWTLDRPPHGAEEVFEDTEF